MRETIQAYQRRTGRAYAPVAGLPENARALAADEDCPTLFRYPGPCGLGDHAQGRLRLLGHPGGDVLYMTAVPIFEDTLSAAHFGLLAILQPLRFSPCPTERAGVYVAANRPVEDDDPVVWVPPSALEVELPWDTLATVAEADACLAPFLARDGEAARASLRAYVEELDAMRRTGAAGPIVPWCTVPRERRCEIMAAAGVRPIWTGRAEGP
jgi:hypothetical protein